MLKPPKLHPRKDVRDFYMLCSDLIYPRIVPDCIEHDILVKLVINLEFTRANQLESVVL